MSNVHDETTWPVWAIEEVKIEEPKQEWLKKENEKNSYFSIF
nr:hypothetical protein [Oceanobacillus manasiensis]